MIAPVTLLVASEQTNKKNQGMNVLHNQSEQYQAIAQMPFLCLSRLEF